MGEWAAFQVISSTLFHLTVRIAPVFSANLIHTMPTENLVDKRMCKFKNRGKDFMVCFNSLLKLFLSPLLKLYFANFAPSLKKMRERRVAECVELRKAQKVESILKRRNISSQPDEEPLSPDYDIDNEEVVVSLLSQRFMNP